MKILSRTTADGSALNNRSGSRAAIAKGDRQPSVQMNFGFHRHAGAQLIQVALLRPGRALNYMSVVLVESGVAHAC
jgi:hypothetical protein